MGVKIAQKTDEAPARVADVAADAENSGVSFRRGKGIAPRKVTVEVEGESG